VTDAAVEVSGLCRRFGSTLAVDRVDLLVASGSVHGLLGPNGAGKTTLLRMLVGLVAPDSGTIRVFGQDPTLGPAQREGVAALIESPRFRPALTAEDNLRMLADLDGGRPAAVIDDALHTVQLDDVRRRSVRHFSLGMRQRLGVAAALVREPRLLILDEPANGLDPAGARDMRQLVRRLAAEGRTILLSSHDMAEVDELCDYVTILRRGAVARTGSLAELRRDAPDPTHRLETADDDRAVTLAAAAGVQVSRTPDGALLVHATQAGMDAYVLALARTGVPVRSLRQATAPLEALFFALTEAPSSEQEAA
jgi:ABC-2 type transport system ATP-binding protein